MAKKITNYRKLVSIAMRGQSYEARCAAHQAAYENYKGRGFDSWVLKRASDDLYMRGIDTRALVKPELARNWMEQPD